MIIIESAEAFVALYDAVLLWARIIGAATAFVLCVVAYAIGPLTAPPVSTVRRAPSWARGRVRARLLARTRARRPLLPWVCTQPRAYEEAG
ncbi:hypothetical protein [Streptomyces justiciae]|uniref:Uncharacterized protein n=1 Tax=Streptomyces justiciae TaxID=2780140 RepID=A0ABU3M8X3_9ACTN|nr:hypothetical protein [Streptomyces justiciae]MDT7847237.1 hypothetical protein [Streptomyces justiciae]